jgi:hypothetical protein
MFSIKKRLKKGQFQRLRLTRRRQECFCWCGDGDRDLFVTRLSVPTRREQVFRVADRESGFLIGLRHYGTGGLVARKRINVSNLIL